VLEAEGYAYSSSLYPIQHDLYGMPDAPRTPFRPRSGALLEIPLTTVRRFGRNLPCAGGGYFRLMPHWLSRANLRRVHRADGVPAIFYLHPWEVDPDQPRVAGLGLKSRLRHYLNLGAMEARLRRLLRDFAWDRTDRFFLGRTGP
jgi:polysaccharide deacetylase family protein (PEP-CTERM system associated)